MNTFLPYINFYDSLSSLDRLRCGKQRLEGMTNLYINMKKHKIDTQDDFGYTNKQCNYIWTRYRNHPNAIMWHGSESWLLYYTITCCEIYKEQWGCAENQKEKLMKVLEKYFLNEKYDFCTFPKWLGKEAFHLSHKSNLLDKDPVYYKFDCRRDIPYVWPNSNIDDLSVLDEGHFRKIKSLEGKNYILEFSRKEI